MPATPESDQGRRQGDVASRVNEYLSLLNRENRTEAEAALRDAARRDPAGVEGMMLDASSRPAAARSAMIRLLAYVEAAIKQAIDADDTDYAIDCVKEKAHIYSGLADIESRCGDTKTALTTIRVAHDLLVAFGPRPPTTLRIVVAQVERIQREDRAATGETAPPPGPRIKCPACGHTFPDTARIADHVAAWRTAGLPVEQLTTTCIGCGVKYRAIDGIVG